MGCSGLTSIKVVAGNSNYDSRNNCNAIIETSNNKLIVGCKNTVIPNSVTAIGDDAFYGCGMTSVTIPNSVITIEKNAFRACRNLTSIAIPNSVTSIGSSAFSSCERLTSVTIGRGLASIGSSAFSYCSDMTTIIVDNGNTVYDSRNNCNAIIEKNSNTLIVGCKSSVIPNSVTNIGNSAFSGCTGITTFVIPQNIKSIGNSAFSSCSNLVSITIPNSVTDIGENAFYYCIGLTSITIPNSVTDIKLQTFSGCSGLTSVIIPESVTSIGNGAFQSCTSMASLTIPYSVTSIGDYVFQNCSGLIDFYCYAENVPTTGINVFNNSSITSATLHIPKNSTESYRETYPWSRFGEIVPIDNMIYTLTYIVDGEVYKSYEVEYGSPITPEVEPAAKEGYTFSGWSEIPETMPNHDVTVTGSFTPNNYILTYIVDGEAYKTYTVAYGSTITPEPAPTKEGYSFSGWSYIPATMPATDVVVMGTFTISSYTLTYKVDGQVYKTYTVEYGAAITPEPEPTKEGYTFSGWSNIPATMPAHNVTVTGTFTKIIIKCATPTISYANGKLTFTCETEGAICHSTITDTDIKSYTGNEVDLTVTYYISVYATKDDFEDSEVATGTLCWIDQQPSTEGIVNEDAVTEVKALPVLIQSNRGIITVQGANEGTEIMVYSVNGMKLGSAIATQGLATISTSLQPGSTAIVKIGEKAIKVLIR